MPKIKEVSGKKIYSCSICGREHGGNILMAESCEKIHNLIFFRTNPKDIKLLAQYILTSEGNKKLLSEELMKEIFKIARKIK